MLIGVFDDLIIFPTIIFGFDIPTKFGGRLDINRAVVFMSMERNGFVSPLRYRIHSFTTSRVEFEVDTISAQETIRVLIVS